MLDDHNSSITPYKDAAGLNEGSKPDSSKGPKLSIKKQIVSKGSSKNKVSDS